MTSTSLLYRALNLFSPVSMIKFNQKMNDYISDFDFGRLRKGLLSHSQGNCLLMYFHIGYRQKSSRKIIGTMCGIWRKVFEILDEIFACDLHFYVCPCPTYLQQHGAYDRLVLYRIEIHIG